jgi:AcrR family transcriptional regulator
MSNDSPRTRLRVAERRAQLLTLGRRLFAERSYEEVAVEDIAAAAGISVGLLYHYFGSKREFYLETMRDLTQRFVELVWKDPRPPGPERLLSVMSQFVDYLEAEGPAFRLLVEGGGALDQEMRAIRQEMRQVFYRAALDRLGIEGEPKPEMRLALSGWVGHLIAASLDWIEHRDLDRSVLIANLVVALVAQLLAHNAIPPGVDLAALPLFSQLTRVLRPREAESMRS